MRLASCTGLLGRYIHLVKHLLRWSLWGDALSSWKTELARRTAGRRREWMDGGSFPVSVYGDSFSDVFWSAFQLDFGAKKKQPIACSCCHPEVIYAKMNQSSSNTSTSSTILLIQLAWESFNLKLAKQAAKAKAIKTM